MNNTAPHRHSLPFTVTAAGMFLVFGMLWTATIFSNVANLFAYLATVALVLGGGATLIERGVEITPGQSLIATGVFVGVALLAFDLPTIVVTAGMAVSAVSILSSLVIE